MDVNFTLVGLLLVTFFGFSHQRDDETSELAPHDGIWGDWGDWQICPDGYYGSSFLISVEGEQGGGDDTAMNTFEMACRSLNDEWADPPLRTQTSGSAGNWGVHGDWMYATGADFLSAVKVRFEASQGGGDDTAMNSVIMRTTSGIELEPNNGGPWGDWTDFHECASGDVICGVRARLEGDQGGGDDTALNGLQFKCCRLLTFEYLSMEFDDVDIDSVIVEPEVFGRQVIANPSNAIAVTRVTFQEEKSKSYTYSFSQSLGVASTLTISAGVPKVFGVEQSITIDARVEEGTSVQTTETVRYEVSQEVRAQPYSCIEVRGSIDISQDEVEFPFVAEWKVSSGSGDVGLFYDMVLDILHQKGFSGDIKEVQSNYMIVTVRGVLRTGLAINSKLISKDLPQDDPQCESSN